MALLFASNLGAFANVILVDKMSAKASRAATEELIQYDAIVDIEQPVMTVSG